MLDIILAILPVFLLICLGYWLRVRKVLEETFWGQAEKITYLLFFPILLTRSIAGADLEGIDFVPMAGALIVAILAMSAALFLIRPAFGVDGPGFTSVYQGAVRMNAYICIAIAYKLYGDPGLAACAVAIATIVPMVNVGSVLMLSRYGSARQPTVVGTLKQILTNPLIVGVLAGFFLRLTGIGLPPVVGTMMDILGRAALPLGLLAIGAGLDLAAARRAGRPVILVSALKLIVMPVMTIALLAILGVGGVAAFVAVLFHGSPAATTSYILARQMGGDGRLMATILTVQILASMVTLPLILPFSPP